MENLEQKQLTQPQSAVELQAVGEKPIIPETTLQPPTPSVPEPKPKNPLLLPILLSLVILVLGVVLVFVYFVFVRPRKEVFPQVSPSPEVSPPLTQPNIFTILGLDLTINKALRVEQEEEKDLLVLTVTFEGNEKCQGKYEGQTCGYSARWFKLKDKDGFVLDQPERIPSVAFLKTNPLTDRVLAFGEKSQGDIFFEIPKDKDVFLLTYTDNLGKETTGEVEITPELFDPTADWEIYKDEEYGFEMKYPDETFDVEQDNEAEYSRRSEVDIPDSFTQFLGYEPPRLVTGIRVVDKTVPETGYLFASFSVWVFDNSEGLSIDQWYRKYWYYPFKWGKAIESVVESNRPKHTETLNNLKMKYTILDDMGPTQYGYASKNAKMFLFAIRGLGDKVLSTFRFLD